jgi:SAM-dependent methyltransferase
MQLPFPDETFDALVCQFGVMFFPDKPAAFREIGRVLTPGGRLLFSTWSTIDTHDFAAALVAGVERAFPDDPPTFVTAVPHGYSDLGQVLADLALGGLERVSAESVTLDGQAGSAADVAVGFCTGTPLRMAIEARGDLVASTAVVSDEMTARLGDGPVTCKMAAHIIEGRKGAN